MHLSFKCAVFCKQELKGEYQTGSLGQAQVTSVTVCPIAFKARSAWKSVGSWGHREDKLQLVSMAWACPWPWPFRHNTTLVGAIMPLVTAAGFRSGCR